MQEMGHKVILVPLEPQLAVKEAMVMVPLGMVVLATDTQAVLAVQVLLAVAVQDLSVMVLALGAITVATAAVVIWVYLAAVDVHWQCLVREHMGNHKVTVQQIRQRAVAVLTLSVLQVTAVQVCYN
jgi:hypothetical protein